MSAAVPARGRGIEEKLVWGSAALLAASLLGLLAVVIWINTSLSDRHKAAAVESIRQSLVAKGDILVRNNSLALQEMVADNAFTAVAGVVSSTVREDADVVYGIYMTRERQPWVLSGPGDPDGAVREAAALSDSASLWASSLEAPSHRVFSRDGGEVIEFAAPVRVDGAVLGHIRYGLASERTLAAILEANRSARQALWRTIGALVGLGALAMALAFLAARRQAARLTRPIQELQAAAGAIARGDYGRAVSATSDDEIGLLAADFDTMRRMVKEYTERLEGMVAEKTREIKDILDNIEQGLFTVGLDGTVNPDYALSTNAVLRVEDAASLTLGQLFRVDEGRLGEWTAWLDLVARKHASMRWEKLARLAPIRELSIPGADGGPRAIQVDYQRIYDRGGRLGKLMILVRDVTEARRIERMVREEKERHENEVKAILGIVRNASSMPDFLEDAGARIRDLERLAGLLAGPGPAPEEALPAVLRDLHTLKGTASTYGFELLARAAREAEDDMATGSPAGSPRPGLERLPGRVASLSAALADVRALARQLSGQGGAAAVAVPEHKVRRLRGLADAADRYHDGAAPGPVSRLLAACRSLDHLPLAGLAGKYRAMLEGVSTRLGKRIAFRAEPEGMEMAPQAFASLDEPLVHLLRNAADHGIEPEGQRLLAGKDPVGRISLELESREDSLVVTVADDGRGIEADKVASKARSLGLVDDAALAAMSREDILGLIFAPGLSTRDRDNDISGRGVGMDAVAAWTRSAGGRITVASEPGKGTRIGLELPARFAAAQSAKTSSSDASKSAT